MDKRMRSRNLKGPAAFFQADADGNDALNPGSTGAFNNCFPVRLKFG
jgi:hypothetical protein